MAPRSGGGYPANPAAVLGPASGTHGPRYVPSGVSTPLRRRGFQVTLAAHSPVHVPCSRVVISVHDSHLWESDRPMRYACTARLAGGPYLLEQAPHTPNKAGAAHKSRPPAPNEQQTNHQTQPPACTMLYRAHDHGLCFVFFFWGGGQGIKPGVEPWSVGLGFHMSLTAQPSTRMQQQGALYQIFPSFLRSSTKFPHPQFWPAKKKTPEIILPPVQVPPPCPPWTVPPLCTVPRREGSLAP